MPVVAVMDACGLSQSMGADRFFQSNADAVRFLLAQERDEEAK